MSNFLFVCSANKQRSKTAEDYFSEKFSEHVFKSAGTNQKICFQEDTNFISLEDLMWADSILVMEKNPKEFIVKSFGDSFSSKIITLNIKDVYSYFQK